MLSDAALCIVFFYLKKTWVGHLLRITDNAVGHRRRVRTPARYSPATLMSCVCGTSCALLRRLRTTTGPPCPGAPLSEGPRACNVQWFSPPSRLALQGPKVWLKGQPVWSCHSQSPLFYVSSMDIFMLCNFLYRRDFQMVKLARDTILNEK